MKDKAIEQALQEIAKQVGDIYHFTRQENLESILNTGQLKSHSGHVSATRNYNLPRDFNNPHNDLSWDKGYNTRLTLDGNKISEHHKVKPLAGVTAAIDDAHDITKYKNSRVSRNDGEAEEAIHTKSLNVIPYIKHVHILPKSQDHIDHYHKTLKPILDKMNISHSIGRKFHPSKNEEAEIDYALTKLNEQFAIELE